MPTHGLYGSSVGGDDVVNGIGFMSVCGTFVYELRIGSC
jgi:hypothetical protein